MCSDVELPRLAGGGPPRIGDQLLHAVEREIKSSGRFWAVPEAVETVGRGVAGVLLEWFSRGDREVVAVSGRQGPDMF